MKTSKRLLSLLLAVVMVITTCSVGMSAFAADKNDDVFTYVTDEGKAVDITYESLNNLINTYAPEIIKLLGDKLTGLGVNVDEVCASDKPIYELLAQLSPALIKLMGSSSVTDEVIKDILLDAGIIGDDVAESDQLDAVKFAYVQYAYLNDAAAPMSIWNLYQFCMDNEKADDKDLKNYCKDTKAVLIDLLKAFDEAFTVAKLSVDSDFATVEEYVRTQVIGGSQFEENEFAVNNKVDYFAPYLLSASCYTADDAGKLAEALNAGLSGSITKIPASLANAKDVVAQGNGFSGKKLSEINASSDANVAAFINKVVSLCKAVNAPISENPSLGEAAFWYYNQPIRSKNATLTAVLTNLSGEAITVSDGGITTFTVQPGEYFYDVCKQEDLTYDVFAGLTGGVFPADAATDSFYYALYETSFVWSDNIFDVFGSVPSEDEATKWMFQSEFTAEDFTAIKNRVADLVAAKGIVKPAETKETDFLKEQAAKITEEEFINGVGSVPAVTADGRFSNFLKFYFLNEVFSSVPLAEIAGWDGAEETISDAMKVAGTHAANIIRGYSEFTLSKAVVPTISAAYKWDDVKPSDKLAIEIVNNNINGYVDYVRKGIPGVNINIYAIAKDIIANLTDSLTLDTLLEKVTDIYKKLAEDPVKTIFELVPVIVVVLDDVLVPLLFNQDGPDEADMYYGQINGIVANLLNEKNLTQSTGSTVGIGKIGWNLNEVLPTLLHWLNGDNSYTYTYYNVDTTNPDKYIYNTPSTGAFGTKYDNDGKELNHVPVILNIYAVDKALAAASASDLTNGKDDMLKELLASVMNLAVENVDNYVAEHGNDVGKYIVGQDGTKQIVFRGLNNVLVALPSIISNIGESFLAQFDVPSDWSFGEFKTDANGCKYNVSAKEFKDLCKNNSPASEVLKTFVDMFVNNWFNALTDFLNDVVSTNNTITTKLPVVASLLQALDLFGKTSILTDALNGFFLMNREHKDSFTFEPQPNGYVGISTLSAYFLLCNVEPLVTFIMSVVNANKGTTDGNTVSLASLGNDFVAQAAANDVLDSIDINKITKEYSNIVSDSENVKAADELLDAVDELLSTLLSNTYIDGFTADKADGILSAAVTFLVNHFGVDTANDILDLVMQYVKTINEGNVATGNGSVDAKKVYCKENLSNLVTQTYVLAETIIDSQLNVKGDTNKLVNSAIKGIISPSAIAVRSDSINSKIMKEQSWTDLSATGYAKDLGYKNLVAGDKNTFFKDLIDSLGVIPAVLGTVLCATGYYNDVLSPILSDVCGNLEVSYTRTLSANANGKDATFAVIDVVSKILNKVLEAPASSLLGLIRGLAINFTDDKFGVTVKAAVAPITNEINGAASIVSTLSPSLGETVSGYATLVNDFVNTNILKEDNYFVNTINAILTAVGKDAIDIDLNSLLALVGNTSNAELLLLVYTVGVSVITNSSLLSSLLNGKYPGLVDMISKLSPSKLLTIIKEVIASTQNPKEIVWTFTNYAAQASNTFSYPKGITATDANNAVSSLDDLVKNLFPLLKSFGVLDANGLNDIINDNLFTNALITSIATGVYGAIEKSVDLISPADLAEYLTDASYGATYTSAANTLKGCAKWSDVKSVNWGFTDGSSSAQQGFVNALAALCRPVNDIVAALLAGGDVNIGELLQSVLDKLEINTTTYSGDVRIKISLNNNILNVETYNTAATDAQTNTIKVNLNDIIAQLKELGIKGGNGYESAIVPLLEALMCDNIKTPAQYLNDYKKAKDNLLINILNPIIGFVNKVADKPFDTLTAVLPNLAYFIDNNGLGQFLDNLLSPVTDIVKVLEKNGVSVDTIISAIAGKSLPDLIGGLIGANLSGLDLRIGNLANCNIQDYLADIINAVLKSNNLNIKISKIDFAFLASLGDLNTVYGAAGTTKQITANQGQVLVTLLRYIENVLINNASAINKLLGGIDAIKKNATIGGILDSVFATIATANRDDIVLAIFYFLLAQPTDTFFDYSNFKYKEYPFEYPSTVDVDFLTVIGPMLDGLVGGLVPGGLSSLVTANVYKDNIISSLATGLYGAVEKVKVGNMSLTDLLAQTGIDFSTDNVASLLTDKTYGQSFEAAAKTIKSAGSWANVKADKLSWGVTDRDSFLHALCAALRPIYGVLDVLLNDGSLGLFNLIYLPGSDGYTSTIVPIMEAFGLYNIKTQYQYRQDMSKEYDAILLDILNPLLDKVEDILNAPVQTLMSMLPNLSLFFANDGLLQVIENLTTPIRALLDAVKPIANVNDILVAAGLNIQKLLSGYGLVGSDYKFNIYDLSASLKPLIGSENIVGLLNKILGLIKIGGSPLGIELMPIDWLQLASHGEFIVDEASQASTTGKRIYVKADPSEVLIAFLRYLINTVNYKDNYSTISNLIGGLIGGASSSVSQVIDQVLGMLSGDTDKVISDLCGLLQTLA